MLTCPGRGRAGVQPGERVPDLEVTGNGGGTRLFEVLRNGRHVLLIPGPEPGGDLQSRMHLWQDQVDVVTKADRRTNRPGLGPAASVSLLRPDGYVAARGSVTSPDNLFDYLHRLFGTTRARQPASASVPRA